MVTEALRPIRLGFRCPFDPTLVDALPFRDGNPRRLAFASVFLFDFRQAKHHTRQHASHRATEVNLLRDGHDADALFTPFSEQSDAFVLAAREPIQFPHNDRFHRSIEDSFPEQVEGGPFQFRAALFIDKPLDLSQGDTVVSQPANYLRLLTVMFLVA